MNKTIRLKEKDYSVLQLLLLNDKLSKTFLYKSLGVSPSGLTKIVNKLKRYNLIVDNDEIKKSNKNLLSLNNKYKYILGVTLGAGFISLVVADIKGNILSKKYKNIKLKSETKMLNYLVNEIKILIEENKEKEFIGLGVALNGIVNSDKGISIFSPHIKWENFKIKEYLEQELNMYVEIDNDVRAMFQAEIIFGKYEKLENAVLLYIKDGIGSSLLINGNIYKGVHFSSGEIGHYIVNHNSNNLCKCGNYGCLEAEFSDSVLIEKINWELVKMGKNEQKLTMMEVYNLANKKKEPYYTIVMNSAYDLGRYVANVVKVLDIGTIIISGEIMHSGKPFLKFFKKGMDKSTGDKIGNNIDLYATRLGYDIENYGAISLIINNLFINKKVIKI